MKSIQFLILAGFAVTQFALIAPVFAQGSAAPVTQLETIVVHAKKVAAAPVTQLETIVVYAHRKATPVAEATEIAGTKLASN